MFGAGLLPFLDVVIPKSVKDPLAVCWVDMATSLVNEVLVARENSSLNSKEVFNTDIRGPIHGEGAAVMVG